MLYLVKTAIVYAQAAAKVYLPNKEKLMNGIFHMIKIPSMYPLKYATFPFTAAVENTL